MILLPLFALLIGMTLLEFYVVIQVGQAIGVLPTLALMVLDAALGAALMRSQGRAVWGRFREALAAGRMPGREALDGALVLAGGAFLITPGFVTDVFGALLLAPPTRAIARRLVVRHISGRLMGALTVPWVRAGRGPRDGRGPGAGMGPGPGGRATGAPQAPGGRAASVRDYDVDGSAVEVEREELRP